MNNGSNPYSSTRATSTARHIRGGPQWPGEPIGRGLSSMGSPWRLRPTPSSRPPSAGAGGGLRRQRVVAAPAWAQWAGPGVRARPAALPGVLGVQGVEEEGRQAARVLVAVPVVIAGHAALLVPRRLGAPAGGQVHAGAVFRARAKRARLAGLEEDAVAVVALGLAVGRIAAVGRALAVGRTFDCRAPLPSCSDTSPGPPVPGGEA